jgi:SulP family sulfate permease
VEPATTPAARPLPTFLFGEAAGAGAATVVALPQALSLGVLAFAALGPQYAGAGVVAALLASVVGNFFAGLSYAVRCQIVGARSSTAALVATAMATLAVHPALQTPKGPDVVAVLALVFAAVMLSGAVQLAFGLARLGRAIKYVPYPVVAGFMNGVAVLIAVDQLRPALGLEGYRPLASTLSQLGEIRIGSIAVAFAAAATTFYLHRRVPRAPPLVGGLCLGIAIHYTFAFFAPGSVGPVVGPLPGIEPMVEEMRHTAGSLSPEAMALLWQFVIPQAVLLAIVGGLDGLLAAVASDSVTRGRHDSDRVLIGQGLGNMAGGLMGALPSQGNSHTPMANYRGGGRTRLATLLHAFFLLLILAALGPVASAVPVAALAGIMMFLAYSLFDRWSGELLQNLGGHRQERADVAANLLIVTLVAAALVAMNVLAALAIGVATSVILLIVKLSGSPVRRRLDGGSRVSHKVRSNAAREALRPLAPAIRIIELQGELFFGTADSLLAEVDALPAHARYLIVDFRRVHQLDATGARVLGVAAQRAARHGAELVLADVRDDEQRGRYLRALGIDDHIPPERWFTDLDRALEWAEDRLLEQARFAEGAGEEFPLGQMALFEGLEPRDLARVAGVLERRVLAGGDAVFLEGEEGDCLYLIARGAVSIKARMEQGPRARRLATFTSGVVFGEMALLEGKPRSADAFAKGDRVVLYALSSARFEALVQEAPSIAARIHRNLARQLAARLRDTSEALRALE